MRYYYAPVPRGLQRTSAFGNVEAVLANTQPVPDTAPLLPPQPMGPAYQQEQRGGRVSISHDIMGLLFAPIGLCFACVPRLRRWCGDTADEDGASAEQTGCFSALMGGWHTPRALKDLVIVVSVTLYVFVLVWEISIHQAMQAWEVGGHTGVVGSCTLSTVPLGTMTLSSYIVIRLLSTLLSLAPMLYLVCMAVHHLQQVANGSQNGPWHHPWLTTFVVLEFVLSLFLLVMDGSAASSLATDWNPGAPCYEAERLMLHYTPSIRLPINTLPIALIALSLPMALWSALFIIHEVIRMRYD
jgi:hypothetical protein